MFEQNWISQEDYDKALSLNIKKIVFDIKMK